jgi:N-acetyl-anhydromuramyl-L-alanine amidase AmpD
MASVTASGILMGSNSMPNIQPAIHHGVLKTVRGIIVHQTDSKTSDSTFANYAKGKSGAHFLIEKDGRVYQTASLKCKTWHVGKLRAKCLETHTCKPAELKLVGGANEVDGMNNFEIRKSVPDRFPANMDSIGIELVGRAILDKKWYKPGMTEDEIEDKRGENGIYERPTLSQNMALQRLIKDIQSVFSLPRDQVFPHSRVSRKNPTEAIEADWKGK